MKRLVLRATALALLSGVALSSAAEAAPYGRHYGKLTPYERAAIARSKAHLDTLKWRARADGRVTALERMRINLAKARHNALVYRYRHS